MNNSLAGRLLIAAPTMTDKRFKRSVILLCDHDQDHAMGIVLNKPMPKLTVPALLDQLGIECSVQLPDLPVLDGGPCQRDRGFVLHSDDWVGDEASVPILRGVHMTATRDVLVAMADGNEPKRSALALGYAGWEAGQLEAEIVENVWLVGDADVDTIFDVEDPGTKWEAAFARIGVAPWQVSQSSGRA